MNSKEYTKELGKLVKLYKKEALKRRVRIPNGYMTWNDFAFLGCNGIAHYELTGGRKGKNKGVIDFALMIGNALIESSYGQFKCYCIDPEFMDSLNFEFANNDYLQINPSIVFTPNSFDFEANKNFSTVFVVLYDEETKTLNFAIAFDVEGKISFSTRSIKIDDLIDPGWSGYKDYGDTILLRCIMVLKALSTLKDYPEYQDANTEPRQIGFGKGSSSGTEAYEYPTMLKTRILPINPIRIDHGGTHASPRPHDRRGHWRRKPKGDTSDLIWVKSSKVGAQR